LYSFYEVFQRRNIREYVPVHPGCGRERRNGYHRLSGEQRRRHGRHPLVLDEKVPVFLKGKVLNLRFSWVLKKCIEFIKFKITEIQFKPQFL